MLSISLSTDSQRWRDLLNRGLRLARIATTEYIFEVWSSAQIDSEVVNIYWLSKWAVVRAIERATVTELRRALLRIGSAGKRRFEASPVLASPKITSTGIGGLRMRITTIC